MKIINRIEINYFRSTYNIIINRTEDLNILIGNNDSGKSNILKALNLFFNNQTELGQNFYFHDDLTRKREQEARKVKGRATIWIKVYFNNFLNWKSLPKEFFVKKVWNRYENTPEISYPKDVSSTQIIKFLNKLSFHYIPAVRGRDIFAHFLTMLHDALFDDEKSSLTLSTNDLIRQINESTYDMSLKINDGVGIKSSIQPPTDLRMLFNALDFSTSYNEHSIPLQKRGDGIQSRHIPFILDFIAKHSDKHHIWAYEEPETSLELGAAFHLASQFSNEFSRENQIFITTHSPAFYDLDSPHITKWYVSQNSTDTDAETSIQQVSIEDLLDQNLGIAALISKRAKEEFDKIEKLKEEHRRLEQELSHKALPHVIVEGITDKAILETAFEKLYPNKQLFCEFISANGASNISTYLKSIRVLSQEASKIIIGLFDKDHEGENQLKMFRDTSPIEHSIFSKISIDKPLYIGLLPQPEEIKSICELYCKENSISEKPKFQTPIEFMFPSELINIAIEQKILEFKDIFTCTTNPVLPTKINLTEFYKEKLDKKYHYLTQEINDNTKVNFSAWIKDKDTSYFSNFKTLFEQIKSIINQY